jgi:hypothetical protein
LHENLGSLRAAAKSNQAARYQSILNGQDAWLRCRLRRSRLLQKAVIPTEEARRGERRVEEPFDKLRAGSALPLCVRLRARAREVGGRFSVHINDPREDFDRDGRLSSRP